MKDKEEVDVYPSCRYHATKPAVVVQNAEEDKALGPGWERAPIVAEPPSNAATGVPEPEPEAEPRHAKKK
jgi:hypothetical protein